jgi:chorismate-pyruvate lyase
MGLNRHRFFLFVTLLLIAIVLRGFWPSYFGLLASGGVTKPWIIHLHGAIFTGWLALLLLQVALASTGRIGLHRRVGQFGIAYGATVLIIGLVVSVAAPVIHVNAGEWTRDEAASFLLLPLVDMILFAGFFGAAIIYRREPEKHKRLILAATVALAFAAVGRIPYPTPVLFFLWLSPLLAGMVFDRVVRGGVHKVYVISFVILTVAFFRIPLQQSAGWMTIGRALLTLTPIHAQEQPQWPDTWVARLEALALIQTLNADILASRSATQSLENWCRDHRLAQEPRIVAHAVAGGNKAPDAEQRQRLDVTDRDEVKYRHVRLQCGVHVLSEADNWYVPSRLTPEMNRLLETTDTPFGTVVRSLDPYRRTFAAKLLWAPLPDGWERGPATAMANTGRTLVIPDALFQHRAVLYDRTGRPFSEVSEIYQRDILAFSPALPQ